jgi:NAD(P) transhydrogenase subunit beta
MTSMPEMVALFNGSGGAASLLVGWATLYVADASGTAAVNIEMFTAVTVVLAILIGGVTFTGSLIAYGKLSEMIGSAAVVFTGQRFINSLLLIALVGSSVMFCMEPAAESQWLYIVIGLSLLLGIMVVIPIGGADMPVVISLLNSYSGIAACAAGFAINNNILIVAGSLVGAAGIILTNIMCKAMNRSLVNVLFSGFGAVKQGKAIEGEVNPISVGDAYYILEAASNVCFVPGYGMAVAQAQHVVKELGEILEANGCEVSYAIHPVAGRMPGHMNVLLAEADVPYEQLVEMDDINPRIENVDVAIVIGANDVVNPSAREDEDSPIWGMPIINVDHARTVFVLKRSMASGFSGVDNPLFFGENTRMLFGDAKESIAGIIGEFS